MRFIVLVIFLFVGCGKEEKSSENLNLGMASIQDSTSQKNIVSIAASSKEHTILVAEVKAAGLLDSLANPGPLHCICSY